MGKKSFWSSCDKKKLERMLSQASDIATFKNIQVIYLKSCCNLEAQAIAKITGFSKGHVWNIHSSYRKIGGMAFDLGKKGGIYHKNLELVQEKSLLNEFVDNSDLGKILEIKKIKKRYEELAQKPVHKSVVYRMLARHGWRKIAPRPSHPKNSKTAVDAFKKTSLKWCKMA
jgi:transposase